MTTGVCWTTWTWTIVGTCLLLLLSSVHSVPLVSSPSSSSSLSSNSNSRSLQNIEDADLTPSSSSSDSSRRETDPSEKGDLVHHHQQLVRQHQFYLPSLMQQHATDTEQFDGQPQQQQQLQLQQQQQQQQQDVYRQVGKTIFDYNYN